MTFRAATVLVLLALAVCASASAFADPMKCETGPAHKTYGGTSWLVYSCADGKSVVFVTDTGSPAMPFYFMLTPKNGKLTLSGEGTGRKDLTDKAFAELTKLGAADVTKLIDETKTKAG